MIILWNKHARHAIRVRSCSISFAAGVFDEAHKLKGASSSTRAAAQALDLDWKLLLTGECECVCVCVCARACVRAHVFVCTFVYFSTLKTSTSFMAR